MWHSRQSTSLRSSLSRLLFASVTNSRNSGHGSLFFSRPYRPNPRISAKEKRSPADNFLQKQQKQRGRLFETSRHGSFPRRSCLQTGPIEGERLAGDDFVGELALDQGPAGPPHPGAARRIGR